MANAKILAEKEQAVAEVTEKFKASASTIIADYRGLNVAQVTQLRKTLREAGIEFVVLKNSLARRATANAELSALDEYLTGPTAIAFSKDDLVAPAKILTEFAKKNDQLSVKGWRGRRPRSWIRSNQSTCRTSIQRWSSLHVA